MFFGIHPVIGATVKEFREIGRQALQRRIHPEAKPNAACPRNGQTARPKPRTRPERADPQALVCNMGPEADGPTGPATPGSDS